MEIIWRADKVREVPRRWAAQYEGRKTTAPIHQEITQALRAMQADGTLTRERVDAAIGNVSWTSLNCQECQDDCERLVSFSSEHGGCSMDLCEDCLNGAIVSLKITGAE